MAATKITSAIKATQTSTYPTLHALNTAKDDLTLPEGALWRLLWRTDTGTASVAGKISSGELDPHPLKTGFLPSRVIGEGTKGYTVIDATRASTDVNGDIVISHGPLTAADDFVRVLLINGIVIDRNVDKVITIWDVVLTTPSDNMGIFQRIEDSISSSIWGQVGILRTAGSWVSDVKRSTDTNAEQKASTTPGTDFRVEMRLLHGTGNAVAVTPEAQAGTGDSGSESALTEFLPLTGITTWDTTADERVSFCTLDTTAGGVATFTLKKLWVAPNDLSLGTKDIDFIFDDAASASLTPMVSIEDAGEGSSMEQLTGDGAPLA